MDTTPRLGQPRPLRHFDQEHRAMGLFRRKQVREEEDERCPNCRERVPEGAVTCKMCGLTLEPVRDASREPEAKRPAASR
jgi:predicted amidophosphoribosyltransferase